MSNLHVNLDEANKHTPKGFDNAATNTRPWKDESNQSTYTENETLPRALNFVDGTTAPPTTTNGHIYVITGTGTVNAGWGSASFNDWVRFANGFPVSISPVTGYLCYDVTASQWMEFDGSTWVAFGGGGGGIYDGSGSLSGATTVTSGTNHFIIDGNKAYRNQNNSLTLRSSTSTALMLERGANGDYSTLEFSSLGLFIYTKQGAGNGGAANIAMRADFSQNIGIGTETSSLNAKLHVKGSGSTSSTTALLVQNSLGIDLLEVKDDGTILGNFGVDTVFTGGTMSTDSTIAMGTNELIFDNGFINIGSAVDPTGSRLRVKGLNTSPLTNGLYLEDSGANPIFEVRNSARLLLTGSSGTQGFFGKNTGSTGYFQNRIENDLGITGYLMSSGSGVSSSVFGALWDNGAFGLLKEKVSGNNGDLLIGTRHNSMEIKMFVGDSTDTNTKIKITATGVGIGSAVGTLTPSAMAHIKGAGSTSATTALLVQNSLGTDLLEVKDDGTILGNFGVDTIFTGGTMSAPSTITMGNNNLQFLLSGSGIFKVDANGNSGGATFYEYRAGLSTTPRIVQRQYESGSWAVGADLFTANEPSLSFSASGTTSVNVKQNNIKNFVALYNGVESFSVNNKGEILSGTNAIGTSYLSFTSTLGTYLKGAINSAQPILRGADQNGNVILRLNNSGSLAVGHDTPTAKLHVKGAGSTSATTALLVQNSLGTDLLEVKDDGTILGNLPNIYGADGTLTGNRILKLGTGTAKTLSFTNQLDNELFKFQPLGLSSNQARFSLFSSGLEVCRISSVSNEQSFINGKTNIGSNDSTDYGAILSVVNSGGGNIKTLNSNGELVHVGNSGDRSFINMMIAGDATIYNKIGIESGTENYLATNTGIGFNSSNISNITASTRLQVRGRSQLSTENSFLATDNLYNSLFLVRNDGNIGINEPTPTAKLHVNGSTLLDGNLGLFGTTPIAQPTTAVAASILGTGAGTGLTDLDTFDGYTLQQVVKALRNLGILA